MAEIISKNEYEQGQLGCATPDRMRQIGRHFLRRTILQDPGEDRFAREATVKITGWDESALMQTFTVEKIADDGRPMGEDMLNIDDGGAILGNDLAENGYLVGGVDPGPEGWNLSRDELMFPVEPATPKVERREDLKVMQLPLPE